MEHKSNSETICNRCARYNQQGFGTWSGDLEIRWGVETIQITPLLRSARILRRVLETWGDLLSLRYRWNITCKHPCEGDHQEKIKTTNLCLHHLSFTHHLMTNVISEIFSKLEKNVWIAHRRSIIRTAKNKANHKCQNLSTDHMPSYNI